MAYEDSTLELLDRCVLYSSLGKHKLPSLRRIVEGAVADAEQRTDAAGRASSAWVRRIPLDRAVKGGHFDSSLCYLVEEVRVETVHVMTKGETPLHVAMIFGRLECAALLLARGHADPFLRNAKGETASERARHRQEKLYQRDVGVFPETYEDLFRIPRDKVTPIYAEGLELLEFMDGVATAGSWLTWARSHRSHPLVKRYEPKISQAEPRFQLAVLRGLVHEKGAVLAPSSACIFGEATHAHAYSGEEPPLLLLPESEEADGFGEQFPARPKHRSSKQFSERERAALLNSPPLGPRSPPSVQSAPTLGSKSPPPTPRTPTLGSVSPSMPHTTPALGTLRPSTRPSSPAPVAFGSLALPSKKRFGFSAGLAVLVDSDLPDLVFEKIVRFIL